MRIVFQNCPCDVTNAAGRRPVHSDNNRADSAMWTDWSVKSQIILYFKTCDTVSINNGTKIFEFTEMGTRKQAEKPLLGQPESVLSEEWLQAFHSGDQYDNLLPWDFKNRPVLVTKRQVLLLYFFFRSTNKTCSKVVHMNKVMIEVKKVWNMSGISTVTDRNLRNKLLMLLSEYQSVMKDSLAHRDGSEEEGRLEEGGGYTL